MANWFTRQLDRFTPFNMPGEQNRRKKREDEQKWQQSSNRSNRSGGSSISVDVARPNQNITVDRPKLQVQRPDDLFKTLNNSLKMPGAPNPVQVKKTPELAAEAPPEPGSVIKPTIPVSVARPAQNIMVNGRRVNDIPDSPETLLNRGLDAGKSWENIAKENNFKVDKVKEYSEATRPNYGVKVEKPKQGFGNRIRDIFDTNTESDKWRRQEGNRKAIQAGKPNEVKNVTQERSGNIISQTPIVGHVLKMANTMGIQAPQVGFTVQQKFATDELGDAQRAYTEARKTGNPQLIGEAGRRVDSAAKRLRNIQDDLDTIEGNFKKNDGGVFNTGTLYDKEAARKGDIESAVKDIVLPTAVTGLDIATLGTGAAIEQALKQGGKSALRGQTANILKMMGGNYASGDLDARANGATGWDPVKSGSINAALGTVPDIGLPLLGRSFGNRVLPKIMSGRGVNPGDIVDELDEAAISGGSEATSQALRGRNIPVRAPEGLPVDIPVQVPVRDNPFVIPQIKEYEGDFNFMPKEQLQQIRVDKQRAEANDFNAATSAPDPRVEGVRPGQPQTPFALTPEAAKSAQDEAIDSYAAMLREVGEGNGTQLVPDGTGGYIRTSNNYRDPSVGSGRMSQAAWREEAERQLQAGKADPAIQKAFDDAADPEVQSMLNKGDTTEDAPIGRPIVVKEAKGIPVRDETTVPTDLPETTGQVRVTESKAPMAAKSEAVAGEPVVSAPVAPIPKVGTVLPDGTTVTKRQVQAARNARKNARAVAKANEDTTAAMQRINESSPQRVAGQGEGFAETGEFARGKRGNAYQKTSNASERAAGEQEMAVRSVDDLITEIGTKESFSPGDRRRLGAAIENMAKSNPDDLETRMILKKLQAKSRTELGQALALIPRVIRRSASADTITGRWENKIAKALDDPTKMSADDLATVQRANNDFTLARDTAAKLEEQFKRTGSESDFKAWEQAYKNARKADESAKFTEASVAKRVLKGQKGAHAGKVVDDLKKESNVNTMDLVTSNMLSGTATGFRNMFGTELAGAENRLFANTRAKVTKSLFGEDVGGFSRKGARFGRKVGMVKLGTDASRRAAIGGKNPLEWAKNWATTINSAGESSLQSQVYSRLGKYYQNQFKDQGIRGKELDMRMRHAMLTDPDTMAETYLDATMKSSGLTGLFDKGQTIEKAVTDFIGKQTDNKIAQGGSKLLMRLLVGFPTATSNFMYQSTKRLTAGLPSYIESGVKASRGDKLGAAQAFDRAMKETGSGMAVLGLGIALGKADMISGAYPDDPAEREQWTREGRSENSIKIGGNWFPIPQGAGMLGLPLLTGAAIGREGDSNESVKEMYSPKNLSKLLPTDQLQGALNMMSGNGAPQDFKNFVASGVRGATPVGALLNQISKSFDDTKNDTTTKSLGANIMDQIYSGLPGINNAMNIPDKKDADGNSIKNPNPLALAFGAASATQGAGEERTAQLSDEAQNALKGLSDLGVLGDKNLEGVLEGKSLEAYKKIQQGKEPSNEDVQKIKEGLVKGVSSEGTDTAYLERGQYDTNLAVLKLKKQLMEADKTVKPSSIKDIDTAIKRGEIYKDKEIPYDMIKAYQETSLEEWRDMGDPDSDNENQGMYQKLWAIDEMMSKAGVSYKKGELDKQKFYSKKPGKGRSGSGARGGRAASEMSTDFGTLKSGSFTPQVQQYESIDQKSGSVPILRKVRPNIVHKIGSSG